MKKSLLTAALVLSVNSVFAGTDVAGKTVNYVYQPDLAPTEFEFEAARTNSCGSRLYRVQSSNEAIANRKFSMVLAAFTSGKKIAFHDKEVCVNGRSLVAWVRIVN